MGQVIERLEPAVPKVCRLLEDAEEDLLAFYAFPASHWSKLRSTNPLERVNREIGRRSDVVGIFPNDASAIRLAGALLIEQNDEWLVCRRYLSAESMALLDAVQEQNTETETDQEEVSKSKDYGHCQCGVSHGATRVSQVPNRIGLLRSLKCERGTRSSRCSLPTTIPGAIPWLLANSRIIFVVIEPAPMRSAYACGGIRVSRAN